MIYQRLYVAILLIAVFATPISNATAENYADADITSHPVVSRVPNDYVLPGMHYRSFVLLPELTIRTEHNDNLFSELNNEKSDLIVTTIPKLKIEKKYASHKFTADFAGFFTKHLEYKAEDLELFSAATGGLIDIHNKWALLYDASFRQQVISRQTPGDTRFTTEPITVDKTKLSLGIEKQFNRLKLTLQGDYKTDYFENGTSKITQQDVIFNDGDRKTKRVELQGTYDLLGSHIDVPEHTLYSVLSYQEQDFISDRLATNPNNNEIGILIGLQTRYKGLLFGKAAIGYFQRNFEENKDVSKLDFELDLTMNITPKLTLSFAGQRNINQDNSFLTGFINTEGTLAVDYELQHNWYAGSYFTYKDREFLGDQKGREDQDFKSAIYTRYLHSPRFESKFQIEKSGRDSNASNVEFDQHRFMYSLTGKL